MQSDPNTSCNSISGTGGRISDAILLASKDPKVTLAVAQFIFLAGKTHIFLAAK